MKSQLLKQIAERYNQKYESYGESSGASSFRDAGNLVMGLEAVSKYFDRFTKDERRKNLRGFRICMNALRDYFKLLDSHPEYRKVELYGDEPRGIVGFPDLLTYCMSEEGLLEQEKLFGDSPRPKAHYILLSKKRLEDLSFKK